MPRPIRSGVFLCAPESQAKLQKRNLLFRQKKMTSSNQSALHLVTDEGTLRARSDETELPTEQCAETRALASPRELRMEIPLRRFARDKIFEVRSRIKARIEHGIGSPIAIVGPCSIHCETAALEYAERLAALQTRLGDQVQLVMRVYFEKPRTTVGWKGFLYDPDLNGKSDLAEGLRRGRALMVKIAALGVPIATEVLDPLAASYLEDCLSWVAIGARTAESQIHRQLASGLDCAVGFKNGTDGSADVALHAMQAAAESHAHLAIDDEGRVAMRTTRGNTATHIVLRGGTSGPNFGYDEVAQIASRLRSMGRCAVLVDCSHGNSEKDYRRQPEVARAVLAQMRKEHADVFGLMLESHLVAGKQAIEGNRTYGMSVTDGCIDFATTEALLLEMASI